MRSDGAIALFGQNMMKLRIQNGLTQREMAACLGIGVESLRKLEKGILPPRLHCDVFDKLFDRFGITADKIFRNM